jgi:hypothetical protein
MMILLMATKQGPNVLFCMLTRTTLLVQVMVLAQLSRLGLMTEMRVLSMATKQAPNVLFCMPTRTKCILLVSLVPCLEAAHALCGHGAHVPLNTRALKCVVCPACFVFGVCCSELPRPTGCRRG